MTNGPKLPVWQIRMTRKTTSWIALVCLILVLVLGRGIRAGVLSESLWVRAGLGLTAIALFLVWRFSEKK